MPEKKQILLVEDEPNIVISLKFLLENAGFNVDVETNGKDALNHIFQQPPSVLVLDVMLPELDGFEILKRVRTDPRVNRLPVLMLTAKGQREDQKNAIEFGADKFITKPFSNAEVVEAVESLVSI
ncbi:MAG: response regulator [Pseudomonadota bacterium]